MKNHHKIQMKILNELMFNPKSKFTELNFENLSSDHLSYHLNNLQEKKLVKKSEDGLYSLTPKGKEFSNTFDEITATVEKQPKTGVLIIATKKYKDQNLFLIQKRLKEPFYGYVGFITGKVRFGEKLKETVHRELKEEANLAGKPQLLGINRDLVYSPQKNLLEDKIFYIFNVKNCEGKLIEKFKGGKNFWVTKQEYKTLENKYYNEDAVYEFAFDPSNFFREKEYVVENF